MLTLRIIAVGNKMPAWVTEAYRQYARRIHGRVALELVEVAAHKRGRNADLQRLVKLEEQSMRQQIPNGAYCIALHRGGRTLSTLEMARQMDQWLNQAQSVSLLIGGPQGLSETMRAQCNAVWSLSALTFAHPVARVVLAEQLYRCYAILEHQPYHRA